MDRVSRIPLLEDDLSLGEGALFPANGAAQACSYQSVEA
jgi:hypothetical protein